jgi:HNH endonuclease
MTEETMEHEHPLYDDDTIERFWSRVKKGRGEHSCWLWTAGRSGEYGCFRANGQRIDAHRFAWSLDNGEPIPEGLMVRHLCDGPKLCVRPDHLGLGNFKANALDEVIRRGGYCGKRRHRLVRADGTLTKHAYVWRSEIKCGTCRKAYRAAKGHVPWTPGGRGRIPDDATPAQRKRHKQIVAARGKRR